MTNIDLSNFLCVIPARDGSKGVYKKNERIVGGKPLVSYSIDHALKVNIPTDNIVVSSNSQSILNLAADMGVKPIERPKELCTDESSSESCLLHALNLFDDKIQHVIMLQPTSPIRFRTTLSKCIETYLIGSYDSLLTTTKLYDFFWKEEINVFRSMTPPRWEFKSNYDVDNRPRRQDLDRSQYSYFDNGNVYITNVNVLINKKCRIGDNPCVFPISLLESLQIDDMDDITIIDAVLSGNVGDL